LHDQYYKQFNLRRTITTFALFSLRGYKGLCWVSLGLSFFLLILVELINLNIRNLSGNADDEVLRNVSKFFFLDSPSRSQPITIGFLLIYVKHVGRLLSSFSFHAADFSVGTQCIVMHNRETGRARGFGFVTLASSGEDACYELERV
jgi:hypothetical protein